MPRNKRNHPTSKPKKGRLDAIGQRIIVLGGISLGLNQILDLLETVRQFI